MRVRRLSRFVRRHSTLCLAVLILFICAGLSWSMISWYRRYAIAHQESLQSLQEQFDKTDYNAHPEHYTALQRSLEIEKAEPLFYLLMVLMLVPFVTVLIVCIIKWRAQSDTPITGQRMEDYRELRVERESRQEARDAAGRERTRRHSGQ